MRPYLVFMPFLNCLFVGSDYSTGSGLLVLNAIQLVRLFDRLSEIISHFELIPDAALTFTRKRCNESQSQSKKL